MSVDLIEVRMLRRDLQPVPWHPPPPPYVLRPYRPGDVDTWVQVHRQAERYHADISADLFHREFGRDDDLLAARQLFLCDGAGAAVGTATAWLGAAPDERHLGRIHWVAVVPAAQGRGLGRALVAALCQRFVDLGHAAAFLTTETVRVPAICMYLKLGFVPQLRDAADRRAWQSVAAAGVTLPEGIL